MSKYKLCFKCGWPALTKKAVDGVKPVQAMVLADTHLLGSRNGHWFDKLRREWQMHRSFQTAMTIHQPEIIFVLGSSPIFEYFLVDFSSLKLMELICLQEIYLMRVNGVQRRSLMRMSRHSLTCLKYQMVQLCILWLAIMILDFTTGN